MSLATEIAGKLNYLNTQDNVAVNATLPYSGYTKVSKKLDNFVFQTSSSFLNKVADKNRYVKFGEKVVDTYGPELITNGDFSNGTIGLVYVSGSSGGIVDGTLKMPTTSVYKKTGLVVGRAYTISISVSGGNIDLYHYISGYVHLDATSNGITNKKYELTFIAKATEVFFRNDSGSAAVIDNISIREIQTAQFTVPNVTEIVAESSGITTVQVNASDYVIQSKTSPTDHTATTFRAKQTVPIGTALTNSAYFEDRTQIGVTNQQLAYHAYNVLTNSYEGIKVETLFSDVSKEDLLDNSVWMARNGFSKVSEFLYSKGSYLVVLVGIWQSLNKGAYHPVFNAFGTYLSARAADGVAGATYWYSTTVKIGLDTVAEHYIWATQRIDQLGGIGGLSGRPDSKYYDILYSDQFIDVREYAKVLTPYEVELIRADKEENGVEEVVSFEYSSIQPVNTFGSRTNVIYQFDVEANVVKLFNYLGIGVDSGLSVYFGSKSAIGYKAYLIVNNTPYVLSEIYGATDDYVQFKLDTTIHNVTWDTSDTNATLHIVKTKPILTSNTKLSIDLIGNPTNYPQVMKDKLAIGVGIVGVNPLLVDDLGNSLIADNDYNVYKYSNKSILALDLIDYNGTSYNKLAIVGSYALATTTNSSAYIDYGAMPSISNKVTINRNTNSSVVLANYASKNNPYIQTTPKAVIEVLPKVKASNSHSIYKGALVGNQVSGKIQVGNGNNGYESKVLEKAEPYITDAIRVHLGNTLDIVTGKKYILMDGFINHGKIVQRTGTTATNFTPSADWVADLGSTYTLIGWITEAVPTHTTIDLDNANSPASKWFECLEEGNNGVLAGVYGKELAYNLGTTSFDGDNDTFDQLTNGTKTDLNGRTIRTLHGAIPINGNIK